MRTIDNKVNHFLLSALLIGLPFSKAVASLAVIGLLVSSIWNFRNLEFSKKDIPYFTPVMIFAVMVLSVLYSSNLSSAWDHLYRQNPMLIFPFIVLVNRRLFVSDLHLHFRYFIIAVSVASTITLFFYIVPTEWTVQLTNQFSFLKPYQIPTKEDAFGAYSPFLDRLHFGYMIGTALLLQLWWIANRGFRWIQFIPLWILGITLLILGARGAQLGGLFAVCIWLIYWCFSLLKNYFSPRMTIILIAVTILFFIFLVPYLAYENVAAIQTRYNQLIWEIQTFRDGSYVNFSYTHFTSIRRIISWQNMWTIVVQHPILGVGIGDFNDVFKSIYNTQNPDFPPNTHQQFLFYWGSSGILGIVAFCYSFFGLLFQGLTLSLGRNETLLVSFWLFFLIVFLLDTPLLYQAGSMSFWIFYLLLLLLKDDNKTGIVPNVQGITARNNFSVDDL